MTKLNLHKFVERLFFPAMPESFATAIVGRSYSPLGLREFISVFLWGFFIIYTFVLAVQNSHTASKSSIAEFNKNEFSKYNQRKLPGNVPLPTTRLGLHSTPNNPAKRFGGLLDCTKSSLLYYYNYFNSSLVGMKSREGLPNREISQKA